MTALLVALLVGSACGRADTPTTSASPVQSDDRPVALWRLEDGFLPPGLLAIRPPRLAVYADGQAVVDAARTLRLTGAQLREIIVSLDRLLSGQPATATARPGAPVIMDASTTVFGVRTEDGRMREVRVPALDESEGGYAQGLYDARDLMERLATRVTSEGQDYVAERVRLVAEQATTEDGSARAWPAGVPEPSNSSSPVWIKDLSGEAVRVVVRLIPHDAEQRGAWPISRTRTGASFAVSWRYLLPEE